jgi:hypothetical protein
LLRYNFFNYVQYNYYICVLKVQVLLQGSMTLMSPMLPLAHKYRNLKHQFAFLVLLSLRVKKISQVACKLCRRSLLHCERKSIGDNPRDSLFVVMDFMLFHRFCDRLKVYLVALTKLCAVYVISAEWETFMVNLAMDIGRLQIDSTMPSQNHSSSRMPPVLIKKHILII